MDLNRLVKGRMTVTIIVVTVIVILSILVAIVMFNILQSTAQASIKYWSVGGAFAGFVISFSLMSSLAFQVYKQISGDEIEKYQDKIAELQSKLVRGAPCEEGYVIEVDEKNKVVFSRPSNWVPKNNILHQFKGAKKGSDHYPTSFSFLYYPLEDVQDFLTRYGVSAGLKKGKDIDLDQLYADFSKAWQKYLTDDFSCQILTSTEERIKIDGFESQRALYSFIENGQKILYNVISIFIAKSNVMYVMLFADDEKDYRTSSKAFECIKESVRFLP